MLHSGHRGRVRNRILTHGPGVLEDHELLEALLFYVIPYRDTNPLAHVLCNTFGSPSAVLSADRDALCRLAGVGESTAEFFALCDSVRNWVLRKRPPLPTYVTEEAQSRLFLRAFENATAEKTFLLLLNNRGQKISLFEIAPANIHSSFFRMSDVVRAAVKANASACVLAHNHLGEVLVPLQEDYDTTLQLTASLDEANVPMKEHFLVVGNRFLSLMKHYGISPRQGGSNRLSVAFGGEVTETPSLPLVPLFHETVGEEIDEEKEKELLSRLLFYAMRKETDLLADNLLLRAPDLASLLRCEGRELLSVEGMTEPCAALLSLLGEILHRRELVPPKKNEPLSLDALAAYIYALDKRSPRERIYLALFDGKGRYIDCVQAAEGVSNAATFTPRRLLEAAVYREAENVILVHTHPDGVCMPSDADILATGTLESLFGTAGIRLTDHLIIAEESYLSIMEYLRLQGK